jgi:DNA repair protein RadC
MPKPTAKSVKRIEIRVTRERVAEYQRVCSNSTQVAVLASEILAHQDQEVVLVFLLDTKNLITGYIEAARGTLDSCALHPREVFRAAVLQSARSIILCHNHPSGDTTPSADDCEITKRLTAAGQLLGIPLLDHVIVAAGAVHFSFLDHGQL